MYANSTVSSSPDTPTIQSLLEDVKNMHEAMKYFPEDFHSDIKDEMQLTAKMYLGVLARRRASALS